MPNYVRNRKQAETDFWAKVQKSDGCWIWKGSCIDCGYGVFGWKNKSLRAHRLAYYFKYGAIPRSKLVLHKCDNPPCVRPTHLWLGSCRDNILDAIGKGRWNPPRGRRWERTHLKFLARGDRHGSRVHPESVPRGERHWNAKLTLSIIRKIRSLYKTGRHSHRTLAIEFGISVSHVGKILKYGSWKTRSRGEK